MRPAWVGGGEQVWCRAVYGRFSPQLPWDYDKYWECRVPRSSSAAVPAAPAVSTLEQIRCLVFIFAQLPDSSSLEQGEIPSHVIPLCLHFCASLTEVVRRLSPCLKNVIYYLALAANHCFTWALLNLWRSAGRVPGTVITLNTDLIGWDSYRSRIRVTTTGWMQCYSQQSWEEKPSRRSVLPSSGIVVIIKQ